MIKLDGIVCWAVLGFVGDLQTEYVDLPRLVRYPVGPAKVGWARVGRVRVVR